LKIVRTIAKLQLDRTKSIAFVPTMGAFHEGHLALMRRAREAAEIVVVSLFVNPTQFVAGEDYDRYPRNEERDFELARKIPVDVMFAPSVAEMYAGEETVIHVKGVSERWEGEHRPGHFDGVATVVAKLFNIVRPNIAVFGLKDFQQAVVIDRMVRDLNIPLALLFEETVREQDGLAMSSRNAYLSPEQRRLAPMLHEELEQLSKSKSAGDKELSESKERLAKAGFAVDYLALVDGATLEPARKLEKGNRFIVAARLGATRLIDNLGF